MPNPNSSKKKRRNRTAAQKHKSKRESLLAVGRKLRVDINNEKKKSPVPCVKLTDEQWQHLQPVSLLLRLVGPPKKDSHGFKPEYEIVSRGSKCTDAEGALVVEADSLMLTTSGKTRMFRNVNLQCVGHRYDNPGTGKILIAQWTWKKPTKKSGAVHFPLDFMENLTKVKKDIMGGDGEKHHGSVGKYYGFGVHASYAALEHEASSSVAGYATSDPEEDSKLKELVNNAILEGEEVINGMLHSVKGVSVIRTGTIVSRCLVLEAKKHANAELKESIKLLNGIRFMSAFVDWNAATIHPHTESDHGMTLVYVPLQDYLKPSEKSPAYFEFVLSEAKRGKPAVVVNIPLNTGTAVYFNGFLVVHHQVRKEERDLLNVSAYGNKMLFDNSRRTILRNNAALDSLLNE